MQMRKQKETNTRPVFKMEAYMWILTEAETETSQLLRNSGAPSGKPVSALRTDLIMGIEANSKAAVAAAGKRQPQGKASPTVGVCLTGHGGLSALRSGNSLKRRPQSGDCRSSGGRQARRQNTPSQERRCSWRPKLSWERVFPGAKPQVRWAKWKGCPAECKRVRRRRYTPLKGTGEKQEARKGAPTRNFCNIQDELKRDMEENIPTGLFKTSLSSRKNCFFLSLHWDNVSCLTMKCWKVSSGHNAKMIMKGWY